MNAKNVGAGLFLGALALVQGSVSAAEPCTLPTVDLERISLCGDGSLLLADEALATLVTNAEVSRLNGRSLTNAGCVNVICAEF